MNCVEYAVIYRTFPLNSMFSCNDTFFCYIIQCIPLNYHVLQLKLGFIIYENRNEKT